MPNDFGDGAFGWPDDPALCDDCNEMTLGGNGRCKYHLAEERRLEAEQRITEELPADADGDEYKLSRSD